MKKVPKKLIEMFPVGAQVSTKQEREAYYSNYAGNPKMVFKPGMVGTVGAVDVPYVSNKNNNFYESFVCVDFLEPQTGKIQRVGLSYEHITLV